MSSVVTKNTLEMFATIRELSELASAEDPPAPENIIRADLQLALEGVAKQRDTTLEYLKQAKLDHEKLNNETSTARAELEALQREFKQVTKNLRKTQKELDRVVLRRDQATRKWEGAVQDYEKVQSDLKQAEAKLDKARKELTDVTRCRDRVESDLKKLAAQKDETLTRSGVVEMEPPLAPHLIGAAPEYPYPKPTPAISPLTAPQPQIQDQPSLTLDPFAATKGDDGSKMAPTRSLGGALRAALILLGISWLAISFVYFADSPGQWLEVFIP